jgi:hypothetical protein
LALSCTYIGTQPLPQYPAGADGFTSLLILIEYANLTFSSPFTPEALTLLYRKLNPIVKSHNLLCKNLLSDIYKN